MKHLKSSTGQYVCDFWGNVATSIIEKFDYRYHRSIMRKRYQDEVPLRERMTLHGQQLTICCVIQLATLWIHFNQLGEKYPAFDRRIHLNVFGIIQLGMLLPNISIV